MNAWQQLLHQNLSSFIIFSVLWPELFWSPAALLLSSSSFRFSSLQTPSLMASRSSGRLAAKQHQQQQQLKETLSNYNDNNNNDNTEISPPDGRNEEDVMSGDAVVDGQDAKGGKRGVSVSAQQQQKNEKGSTSGRKKQQVTKTKRGGSEEAPGKQKKKHAPVKTRRSPGFVEYRPELVKNWYSCLVDIKSYKN